MNSSPRRKPLWRWEAFLFGLVLLLAIVAGSIVRAGWGLIGALVVGALLVVAVAAAALLIVPLVRPGGRDSENTLRSVEGVELVPLTSGEAEQRTVRVLQSERRQSAIEAARAKSAGEPRGVLTPDASVWLGRRLQVAVDLVSDGGTVYRVGFVPPELEADLERRLRPLAERGAAALVPVRIVGESRPFRVEILLPPQMDTSA
ncbi:hypothetical protein [Herbiconiux liukaitaii]|uniref:hypothetical protein n=1 Tax=Herbiconiux liukaitaii TaxID=3342799 RepID=UPI0035B8EC75